MSAVVTDAARMMTYAPTVDLEFEKLSLTATLRNVMAFLENRPSASRASTTSSKEKAEPVEASPASAGAGVLNAGVGKGAATAWGEAVAARTPALEDTEVRSEWERMRAPVMRHPTGAQR